MSADNSAVTAYAEGAIDDEDLLILQQIAMLFEQADPVPTGLVERVEFGLTLDALEAEVAQLQRMESSLAGARSGSAGDASAINTVTFTSESLSVTISITATGVDTVRIDGWAAPGAGLQIELRRVGSSQVTSADQDGRFVLEDVPKGLAKFVITGAAGTSSVITPSMEL